MKLYWSPRSPFVRKVMVAVHELNLADQVETVPIIVRMDEPNPDMLAANPLGKIPALVLPDGSTLFDSLAIIDHLNETAGGALIPVAGAERRRVLRQHALANGMMDMLVLWRNERDKPKEQQSQGWIGNFGLKTATTLDVLEATVDELEAEQVSLGHISIAVALGYLDFRFPELAWRNGRPALAAWHKGFSQRPSMLATWASV